RDLVAVAGDLDVLDAGAAEEVDPPRPRLLGEEVLETPPVELVGGHGQTARGAALDALGQLAVVTRGEPEAQAVLVDLLVLEVVLEAEDVAEVVAGDLLGRLANLERGLSHGELVLLGDEDARLRPCLLQLMPERQPGEAAPEDRDVVAVGRLVIVRHGPLLPPSRLPASIVNPALATA